MGEETEACTLENVAEFLEDEMPFGGWPFTGSARGNALEHAPGQSIDRTL